MASANQKRKILPPWLPGLKWYDDTSSQAVCTVPWHEHKYHSQGLPGQGHTITAKDWRFSNTILLHLSCQGLQTQQCVFCSTTLLCFVKGQWMSIHQTLLCLWKASACKYIEHFCLLSTASVSTTENRQQNCLAFQAIKQSCKACITSVLYFMKWIKITWFPRGKAFLQNLVSFVSLLWLVVWEHTQEQA